MAPSFVGSHTQANTVDHGQNSFWPELPRGVPFVPLFTVVAAIVAVVNVAPPFPLSPSTFSFHFPTPEAIRVSLIMAATNFNAGKYTERIKINK